MKVLLVSKSIVANEYYFVECLLLVLGTEGLYARFSKEIVSFHGDCQKQKNMHELLVKEHDFNQENNQYFYGGSMISGSIAEWKKRYVLSRAETSLVLEKVFSKWFSFPNANYHDFVLEK